MSSVSLPDIGSYVVDHVDELVDAWAAESRVESDDARHEQWQALKNSLPDFLEAFGKNLAAGRDEIPRGHATEHGLQRWEIGWDIEALSRDFLILRRVMLLVLHRDIGITAEQAMSLAATMDEAVAVSIGAYVLHREQELGNLNEGLRRRNYDLKRFAHMVAHEVRNPLFMISVATTHLAELYKQDGASKPHFENIERGRQSIIDLLDNLVEYADIGLRDEEAFRDVDLNEVFRDAMEHLRYLIASSDARVSAGALPTVPGDPVGLRTIFQNLIENAIKYAGDARPDVTITARTSESDWSIQFRDQGVGIASEDHERIFRFLARANADAATPGTGIGLAMCRRIADQHRGTLTVESAPGEGSTFTLTLPRGREARGSGSG